MNRCGPDSFVNRIGHKAAFARAMLLCLGRAAAGAVPPAPNRQR